MAGTIARLLMAGVAASALTAAPGPAEAQERSATLDAGDLSLSQAEWLRRYNQWVKRATNAADMHESATARCDIAAMNRWMAELTAVRDEFRRAARGLKALGDVGEDAAGKSIPRSRDLDAYAGLVESMIQEREADAARRNCGEQAEEPDPPTARTASEGVSEINEFKISGQQSFIDEIESALARAEEARLAGDCKKRASELEEADNLLFLIDPKYFPPEWIKRMRDRMQEIRAAACPPADTPPPSVRISLWGGYGEADIPATGIGFRREGPPGEAPETFAGTTPEDVDFATVGITGFFYVPGTDTPLRIRGDYRWGDGAGAFDIPREAGIDSGIVYSELSPGGSSGIATPFGLTGTTGIEFSHWSIELSAPLISTERGTHGFYTLDPDPWLLRYFGLYGSFGHIDRDYSGMASYSGASGEFVYEFAQDRRQEVREDHFGFGLDGRFAIPLGGGVFANLGARAGGYYRTAELDSIERNSANFGPSEDRDFIIEIEDSDDGFGFESALGAALEILLTPELSLTFGGTVDYRSEVGAVFNPHSGDQVYYDGRTAALETGDAWSWRIGAGLVLRLPPLPPP